MYPRGGGVWDQDPILMQHFRVIRDIAVKWKDQQHPTADLGGALEHDDDSAEEGLEAALNAMLEQMGENGTF